MGLPSANLIRTAQRSLYLRGDAHPATLRRRFLHTACPENPRRSRISGRSTSPGILNLTDRNGIARPGRGTHRTSSRAVATLPWDREWKGARRRPFRIRNSRVAAGLSQEPSPCIRGRSCPFLRSPHRDPDRRSSIDSLHRERNPLPWQHASPPGRRWCCSHRGRYSPSIGQESNSCSRQLQRFSGIQELYSGSSYHHFRHALISRSPKPLRRVRQNKNIE